LRPRYTQQQKIGWALEGIELTTATASDVRDQCPFCSYMPWTRFSKMFPEDNLTHPHRGKIIKQGDEIVRMRHSAVIFETYHRECAGKILKQINDKLNKVLEKV
jgi:hypothetical protein